MGGGIEILSPDLKSRRSSKAMKCGVNGGEGRDEQRLTTGRQGGNQSDKVARGLVCLFAGFVHFPIGGEKRVHASSSGVGARGSGSSWLVGAAGQRQKIQSKQQRILVVVGVIVLPDAHLDKPEFTVKVNGRDV
jgi:hypothetical protein